MKNTQLATALKTLTKSEFRQFGNFIKSPYFNNRSEVMRFYEALKIFYPGFNMTEKDIAFIFQKVYPGKKVNGVLMRKLFSLTTNLLMEFITVNNFRENKFEFGIKMIDMLREKKLSRMFEKKSRQINSLLQNSIHNLSYYESKLKYTSLLNGYLLNTNEKSMVSKMQNELDDLMEYFLTVLFVQYIRLGEWSRNLNVKFDLKFQDEVLKYYSSNKSGEVTLAALYYNMLMLLNTEDEKYYFELMKGRNKFESKLSDLDDYNIAIVSMQYCYKKVIKGSSQYRHHQFEITKNMLKKHLIPSGYIEPYFFTNAIRNATNIQEFKWAENFIIEYKERLNPDIAEEIIDYSHAMTEFGKGNYENSLERLSKINIERSNMKLDIKNLQIVNYYELDYKIELESLIDTYKHFLHRDKSINQHFKNTSLQFLNFVSELIKVNTSGKNTSAYILKKEIANAPFFNFKEWLIKKAEELEFFFTGNAKA